MLHVTGRKVACFVQIDKDNCVSYRTDIASGSDTPVWQQQYAVPVYNSHSDKVVITVKEKHTLKNTIRGRCK